MYPENPEGTVIVGSGNMGYISATARNRTHNLVPSGSRYHSATVTDFNKAEAARGWYKWIYIRQRQPGVGINGFISGRGSPGLV